MHGPLSADRAVLTGVGVYITPNPPAHAHNRHTLGHGARHTLGHGGMGAWGHGGTLLGMGVPGTLLGMDWQLATLTLQTRRESR